LSSPGSNLPLPAASLLLLLLLSATILLLPLLLLLLLLLVGAGVGGSAGVTARSTAAAQVKPCRCVEPPREPISPATAIHQ
jgi:hypothetical protein